MHICLCVDVAWPSFIITCVDEAIQNEMYVKVLLHVYTRLFKTKA